ncbi:MAG TPA: hypothetical protein VFR63_00820 [Gaiellaceae bacterium]|nr:hypothetical protein [Gaiellaceae bacterium]
MTQMEQRSADASGSQGDSMVAETKEKVQEGAGQAMETARSQASQATDRLRRTVDERSTDLGRRAGSMAQAMRKTSVELRAQGKESEASLNDRAAGIAERVGGYLEEADAQQMMSQVQDFGRRRPWVMALAGAGVGLVGARLLKSSASRSSGRDSSRTLEPRPGYESVGTGYEGVGTGYAAGGSPSSALSPGSRP